MNPFVSVIVITKNNAKTVDKCLASLLNQTYSKESYEIIFVDGHSVDGTDKIIMKHTQNDSLLKLYYEDGGTMGFARNLGLSKSKGSIIAFTDADAVTPEDWIERIVSKFSNDALVAVGGWDELPSSSDGEKIIENWRMLRKPRSHGVNAIPLIKTVNFAIRRHSLLACGGFDPTLSHWDEAELLARLHSKERTSEILYDPEIAVQHKRPGSASISRRIRKVFKKSLIGTPVLLRRYTLKVAVANPTSSFATGLYLILAWIVGLPLFLFLMTMSTLTNTLIFALLLYFTALLLYTLRMFMRTKKITLMIPLFFVVDSFARLAGTFFGLLKYGADLITSKFRRKGAQLDYSFPTQTKLPQDRFD